MSLFLLIALYCPGILQGGVMNDQQPKGACESDRKTDNCSSTDFCFIHSNSLTQDGYLFGHCCPRLPPGSTGRMTTACPTVPSPGLRCPTKTDPGRCTGANDCYDDIPDRLEIPTFWPCKIDIRYYLRYHLSPNKSCCPIACPDEGRNNQASIAGTGRCFVRKTYGDICEYTAECPNDARCRPSPRSPSKNITLFINLKPHNMQGH